MMLMERDRLIPADVMERLTMQQAINHLIHDVHKAFMTARQTVSIESMRHEGLEDDERAVMTILVERLKSANI